MQAIGILQQINETKKLINQKPQSNSIEINVIGMN